MPIDLAGNNVMVDAAGDVTLRAGQSIALSNGFWVAAGAKLTLAIDPALFCDVSVDADEDSFDACLDCNDENGDLFPGAPELCDGVDNDCDPLSVDGSGDPLDGESCDGGDGDLCPEGIYSCAEGSLACSDDTGTELDVCDGVDNDCDGASPDGSEDPLDGTGCDGPDSDHCLEGLYECVAGSLACTDLTTDDLDVCDAQDNDCNPETPDGADDPRQGEACDGPDSDACAEGTLVCTAGDLACSDSTGNSLEICNNEDDDCDGVVDEGLPADSFESNDSCSTVRTLTTVGSDQSIAHNTCTLYPQGDDDYFRIVATETDSSCECCNFSCTDEDFQLHLRLTVPSGAGSYVFCTGSTCSGVNASCQQVLGGQSATWTWTLDGGCPGLDSYERYVRIYPGTAPGFGCVPYTFAYQFIPGCF